MPHAIRVVVILLYHRSGRGGYHPHISQVVGSEVVVLSVLYVTLGDDDLVEDTVDILLVRNIVGGYSPGGGNSIISS